MTFLVTECGNCTVLTISTTAPEYCSHCGRDNEQTELKTIGFTDLSIAEMGDKDGN